MQIIALLSWYDEPRESLLACVEGLAGVGVDTLVAVDGAYGLYPDGKGWSQLDGHGVLAAACQEFGINFVDYAPTKVWDGNEVEKRTFLFRLGYGVSEPGDWFFVIDADEICIKVPGDLRARLEATEHHAAEVMFRHLAVADTGDWPPMHVSRRWYRAQKIHVDTNHFSYVGEEGRKLWLGGAPGEVPALDLSDLLIEHRYEYRSNVRHRAKVAYHEALYESGAELGECDICGKQATARIPDQWVMTEMVNGELAPVAKTIERCAQHAQETEDRNREILADWGYDVDNLKTQYRYNPVFPNKVDNSDKGERVGLDARYLSIRQRTAMAATTSQED